MEKIPFNFGKSIGPSSKTPGIYFIECLSTGKWYIGQAKNLRNRWVGHRMKLRKGNHNNAYLQRSFDKYGEEDFYFGVLEFCSKEDLAEREIFWINEKQTMHFQGGYNLLVAGEAYLPNRVPSFSNNSLVKFEFLAPNGEIVSGVNLHDFGRKHGLDPAALGRVLSGKSKSCGGFRSVNPDFHRKRKV